MKIILASASPRRKELLAQIGIPFQVVVSHVEEVITQTEPGKVVEELSLQKASAVAELMKGSDEELLVIGADTVVACDGQILGKPSDEEEAVAMLRSLSGRSHEVFTGVTLLHLIPGGKVESKVFHERTAVTFCEMSEEEISGYVASGDPMDKAGAYGIQGFCARYIRGIEGDYNNVVGLPVGRLYQEGKVWLG
ncbi:MAG: Maf family protein [Acetatifactor sp.]|nr:Maf family protein [Acetatifactor sp.]